jgi:DNA-directed RNA polymerase subunit RPC12/RpoP
LTLQIEQYLCQKTGRPFTWIQEGNRFHCSECGAEILVRKGEIPKLRGRQA